MVTPKAPTVVLFDKAKQFHSFGFERLSRRTKIDDEQGQKMPALHRLSRRTKIDDEQGQKMPALHPEAAAVFCKHINFTLSTAGGQAAELEPFGAGSKFMVINLGGGTADITVHEVQYDGTLAALAAPSGGPWGGTLVESQLDKFLIGFLGKDVIDKFSEDFKPDKLDMDRMTEVKKRQIIPTTDKVHIKLPTELYGLYTEQKVEEQNIRYITVE
ncbi:HS12B-like protein [Mya arenaria]|uniref:HS12B-like protein n=1 Tax=Mya arenaria TaxID=6604 RepID=A0ABY7DAN1_MYAAR|nr:HS12B-like protein [Mya arenaria]